MFEIYAMLYDRKYDLFIEYKPTGLMSFDNKQKAQDRCSYLNSYYSMPEIRFMVKEV